MPPVHRQPLPPWPQLSFVMAKEILQHEWHKGYLTPTEIQHYESAIESYGRWFAFITASHENLQEVPLSERAMTAMRVRAMLTEWLVPHLFHTDRPCCRTFQLDIDQLCDTVRSLDLPDIPSPVQLPVQELEPPAAPVTPKEGDEPTVPSSTTNIRPDIPLCDIYHTLEKDHAAMVELQKLEEFEAQEEMNDEGKQQQQDNALSLINATGNFNLKYLLQGIAANRDKTSLSDRDIKNLLSDFKPQHRTKWANDDKIGQEELYEACEKVLTDLKNFTDHSTPFLNKVTKREAPDYFEVIKHPMDLGTVTKKLKGLQYKSKKEFADDLYLIYENCLIYNTNPASEYRKHANAMRRKTDRLLTRVPDITVRDRSEVEAEEFGDEASEDGDAEVQRVPRKGSGKKKQSPHLERKDGMDQLRFARERSLTRESSAAPSGTEATQAGSDSESIIMTPNGHAPHKTYGGKHVKGNQTGEVPDEEDKEDEVDLDGDYSELQDQVWRDMTKKTRAKLGLELEKEYQFQFSDRHAIVRSSLDMERFALMEHLHQKPETIQKLVKCTHDRFYKWAERTGSVITLYDDVDLDSSDDENLDVFFSRKLAKPNNNEQDEAMRTDLFLPEYQIASGFPEIHSMQEDTPEMMALARRSSLDDNASVKSQPAGYTDVPLDVYPSVRFPNHGLSKQIDRNLQQLQKIRLIYAKCNAIRNNAPISTFTAMIPPVDSLIESQASSSSLNALVPIQDADSYPPLIINRQSGMQLMQRTLSKLLAHAGFEGAQSTALNVLSELFVDYLSNVGKTLRSYWDDYGRQMSKEEMLMHGLYENGVADIGELESYIRDDVERYGHRLDELHRKLESSYNDLLSGPTEKTEEEENMLLEDGTFVTGAFGEDLGDDYFGFKALGLDQEYNVEAFSIPPRLWFGGNKEKVPSKTMLNKEPEFKYPPAPPFTPVTSEKQMIGLLQPLFQKKLADAPNGRLTEDEYVPNRQRGRPRYPPTNKLLSGRKKPLKDAGSNNALSGASAGGDTRKTKRKRPPEEIQAIKEEREKKRRQKMEERAQRAAEKEEKRKLREELKEQERLAKQEAKDKKAQAKKPNASGSSNS
ncbi:hypothetical protein K492DRAFT_206338 [Lichtheimia hyalospora FSU 10163]|nr:hypothetical protein K492DRAFT_206338 [Lichtheimia hyalospora FSU 10163]